MADVGSFNTVKNMFNSVAGAVKTGVTGGVAGAGVQSQAGGTMNDAVDALGDMMKQSIAANSSMLSQQMSASETNTKNGMAAQQAMAALNQAESLNEAEIKITNKATDGVKSAISG